LDRAPKDFASTGVFLVDMKPIRHALLLLTAIAAMALPATAAEVPRPVPPSPQQLDPATGLPTKAPADFPPEPRFDLDFQGGPPSELVKAIEKSARIPLNVIIPEEHQNTVIPRLKLSSVTVPEVFRALTLASEKRTNVITGWAGSQPQWQTYNLAYGFKTPDNPSARSVWYFYSSAPAEIPRALAAPFEEPKTCRFWLLEPYLGQLKVEDITTAIETGWKMLGKASLPKMSFHKDTKLLIVVGTNQELNLVDDVLRQLTPSKTSAKDAVRPPPPGYGAPVKP